MDFKEYCKQTANSFLDQYGPIVTEADAYMKGGKEVFFKDFGAIPFVVLDYGAKKIFFRGYRGHSHARQIRELFESAQKNNVEGISHWAGITPAEAKRLIQDITKYKYVDQFISKYHYMITGRYFERDKVLGFWVLRKQKIDRGMIDFVLEKLKIKKESRDDIRLLFDDDWNTKKNFEDMITYADFVSQKSSVRGNLSAEDKANLHAKSPMKLTAQEKSEKMKRGAGFGSTKKIAGTTATQYHQKLRTSESTIMEADVFTKNGEDITYRRQAIPFFIIRANGKRFFIRLPENQVHRDYIRQLMWRVDQGDSFDQLFSDKSRMSITPKPSASDEKALLKNFFKKYQDEQVFRDVNFLSGRFWKKQNLLAIWAEEKKKISKDDVDFAIDSLYRSDSKYAMRILLQDDYGKRDFYKIPTYYDLFINQKDVTGKVTQDQRAQMHTIAAKKLVTPGFGSKSGKGGTMDYQKKSTSEGSLLESPDAIIDGDKEIKWYEGKAVTWGVMGDLLFFANAVEGRKETTHITLAELIFDAAEAVDDETDDDFDPNEFVEDFQDELDRERIYVDGIVSWKHILMIRKRYKQNPKIGTIDAQQVRTKFFDFCGRYWKAYNVIALWNKRSDISKAKFDWLLDSLKAPRKSVKIEFTDNAKREYLTYDEFKSNSATQKTQNLSKEEEQRKMADLHIKPPSKITDKERELKRQRAKGFGSDKRKGGMTATRYHQKRYTSESVLSESPDWFEFDGKKFRWRDQDTRTFRTFGKYIFYSKNPGVMHGDLFQIVRKAVQASYNLKGSKRKETFLQFMENHNVMLDGYDDKVIDILYEKLFDVDKNENQYGKRVDGRYWEDFDTYSFWNHIEDISVDLIDRLNRIFKASDPLIQISGWMQNALCTYDEFVADKEGGNAKSNAKDAVQRTMHMIAAKKAPIKGFGSQKSQGGMTATQYHQKIRTSESTLNESPDTAKGPNGQVSWNHPNSYAFFVMNGHAIIAHRSNHPEMAGLLVNTYHFFKNDFAKTKKDLEEDGLLKGGMKFDHDLNDKSFAQFIADIEKKLGVSPHRSILSYFGSVIKVGRLRSAFDLAGRFWTSEKVISVWSEKNAVKKADLDKVFQVAGIDPKGWKINFLDNRNEYDEYVPYSSAFKSNDTTSMDSDEKQKLLSKLHTTADSQLTDKERELKKSRAKGFGSEKRPGGMTATQHHQMRRTSESSINESPDSIELNGKTIFWYDKGGVTFGSVGLVIFMSNSMTHRAMVRRMYNALNVIDDESESDLYKDKYIKDFKQKLIDARVFFDGKITWETVEEIRKRAKKHQDNVENQKLALRNSMFDIIGRYWRNHNVVSFWNLRSEVSLHFLDHLLTLMKASKNDLKIEFIDNKRDVFFLYDEFKSNDTSKTKSLLSDRDRKKKSALHIQSPMNPVIRKQKVDRGKGFGSQKERPSGLSPTQYHQAIRTSEGITFAEAKRFIFEANIGIQVDHDAIDKVTEVLAKQMDQTVKAVKKLEPPTFEFAGDEDPQTGFVYFAKSKIKVITKGQKREIPILVVPTVIGTGSSPVSGGSLISNMKNRPSGYKGPVILIKFFDQTYPQEYQRQDFKERASSVIAHEIAHSKDEIFQGKLLPGSPESRATTEEEKDRDHRQYVNRHEEVLANIPGIIQELRPWANPEKSLDIREWMKGKMTTGKMVTRMVKGYSTRWKNLAPYLKTNNKKFILKKIAEFLISKLGKEREAVLSRIAKSRQSVSSS